MFRVLPQLISKIFNFARSYLCQIATKIKFQVNKIFIKLERGLGKLPYKNEFIEQSEMKSFCLCVMTQAVLAILIKESLTNFGGIRYYRENIILLFETFG